MRRSNIVGDLEILRAIASGKRTHSEILISTGYQDVQSIRRRCNRLIGLGAITKSTSAPPTRRRSGLKLYEMSKTPRSEYALTQYGIAYMENIERFANGSD